MISERKKEKREKENEKKKTQNLYLCTEANIQCGTFFYST